MSKEKTFASLRNDLLNDLHAFVLCLFRHRFKKPAKGQAAALRDTPRRWLKALHEMTVGYDLDEAQLLSVQFDGVPNDQMVVLKNVEFSSLCEHHLMPFVGKATVGYIPASQRVVGLSKLARLVEGHAKRLQVQERMTHDIAQALQRHLKPLGAGCIISATHSCMACRGINKTASMITSSLTGKLREARARAEFLSYAQ